MKNEEEVRKEIAEIIRNGVTYSHQTGTVIIHGAIDELIKKFARPEGSNQEAITIANEFLEWFFSKEREAIPLPNPIKIDKSFGYWLLHHSKYK